ncbi:hypothetical protein BU23DRAFT_558281 [Bimuria novae-zelandiae CBS 107.79]|uniref:PH domain-containing protein n=1 Tax=Bimuria novae-zelandiae CBS 107.79 TaxID=1447943 RepID=A0A6A5UVK7_9PLEO|nr:hypothetical protein BU23DRAFT_558281 [Bimuria novae-zelandiae CBS 107.79]
MADPAPSEPPPAQKFSRYRSVRRAQAQPQQKPGETPPMPAVPAIPMDTQNAAPVSRSMSRYHRRPATSHAPAAKAPPLRSATVNVPAQPAPVPTQNATPARNRAVSSPYAPITPNAPPRMPNTSCARAEAPPMPSAKRPQTSRDQAKQLMQDEAERQKRMREKIEAEKRAKLKAEQAERERQEQQHREAQEAERLRLQEEADVVEQARREKGEKEEKERGKRLQKAESAKRLQEREEAERKARLEEATRKAQAQVSSPASPPRQGGRFGIFSRRRDNSAASQSPPSTARPPQTSCENRDMDTIRPGGGGAVLGIDAPISAVNAGDRRVSILCNGKTFLLPVTPETSAQDLLRSASTVMTEKIDVHTDIFVEHFAKVSVYRPLRMYEHVRDVMNSWDNDTQNDLEIVNAAYKGHDRQALLSSKVPNEKPEGLSCFIYYSSRPGKWNKKYITLRADGQLVMAKNETAKDQENICHMSDFDIYRPTERKQKKIKPPKSICYAVKSQQKSNIFSDESRYVHFFCTSDERTSVKFYNMLQTWRSWHLKHVMGEGQEKPKAPDAKPANAFLAKTKALGALDHGATSSHARSASDSSFYQLGSFKPLFNLEEFGKSLDQTVQSSTAPEVPLGRKDTRAMHARKMSTRQKAPPPVAYSRSGLVDEIPDMPVVERSNSLTQTSSRPDEETFAAGGLLGRKYSERQKAAQDREANSTGPFTDGPSLVSNVDALLAAQTNDSGGLNRRSSVRSTHHRRTSSDIQRSTSARVKPRPLVDLTPQYKEPPQHRNKGKGFVPEGSAGPLIENATSLEEAIHVPPSTDWRAGARPPTARVHGTYATPGHERTRSLKGRTPTEGLAAYTVNNHTAGVCDANQAFTGGGLLARAGLSQGAMPVGHGVVDGSRARGPLVDLSEGSRFAEGSLLANVERGRGKRASVDLG